MTDPARLDRMCTLLTERYGATGTEAAARLRRWISGAIPYAKPEMIERHLDEPHAALVFDAFRQVLPFGTGGRRGPMGYGANRMNPSTVAMTAQGHANYLREQSPDAALSVVVANDVRVFADNAEVYAFLGPRHPLLGVSSRSLARLACEIYAANGIVAYLAEPEDDHAVTSTPELSFYIVQLGAGGGMNVSASHNPPDDNGIKVYDSYGSQPVAPEDQRLVDAMDRATAVRTVPFAEGLRTEMIRPLPGDLHTAYVDTYVDLYGNLYPPRADAPVVYTPLCGCGVHTVKPVLERLGFPVLMPPDQGLDGSFAAIPFKAPNPEVPHATAPAREFADRHGAGIVLSSDPDADRIGMEARLEDGSWYHFDGNQIAAILCHHLMLDPEGPRRRGLVMETLVTTKLLGRVVAEAGDSWLIDDLLVGFKYVADVLKTLERTGRYKDIACAPGDLVLAAEESHGVVMAPGIRDKDATPACMVLAGLYQRLLDEGRTMLDYYVAMLRELGGYDNVNRSIALAGAEGSRKKDRIMAALREAPPRELGGRPVQRFVDYWDPERFGPIASETDRLPRNVLQAHTDRFVITMRPSGTEPKLKLYCQLLPDGETLDAGGTDLLRQIRARADAVVRTVYNEMLSRIDVSLDEAALLLPDIIDLEGKQRFGRETVPRLRDAMKSGKFAGVDGLLDWLRREAAAMTPASDPLPALKPALAYLCRQWRREAGMTLVEELENWAERGL
ncbi:MAG: phospho-sugar mutase [Deltaproteobacteria bacterium]|nr:phospho-sugar mutase [Deltaproteobacteria bacterium]